MPLNAVEWMDEIDNALDYRFRFAKEEKWEDLEASYLNDADSDASVGENLIYSMGDSLISSLMNPDPEFVVTATHPLGLDKAPVIESLDNAFIGSLNLKQAVDMSLLHCYLNSVAILKLGYYSEYGYNPYFDIALRNTPYIRIFHTTHCSVCNACSKRSFGVDGCTKNKGFDSCCAPSRATHLIPLDWIVLFKNP